MNHRIDYGSQPVAFFPAAAQAPDCSFVAIQANAHGQIIVNAEQWDALNARLDRLEALLLRLQPGSVPHLAPYTGDRPR